MNELSKYLRKKRIDKGVTQGEMAKALGISDSYLSAVESGKKPLNCKLEAGLIEYLGLQDFHALAEFKNAVLKMELWKDSIPISMAGRTPQARGYLWCLRNVLDNIPDEHLHRVSLMREDEGAKVKLFKETYPCRNPK